MTTPQSILETLPAKKSVTGMTTVYGATENDENREGSDYDDFSKPEEDLVEDGADLWSPVSEEDDPPPSLSFSASPGPQSVPPRTAKPIDYVCLFLDDQFIHNIVRETNWYIEDNQEYLARHPRSMGLVLLLQSTVTGAFIMVALKPPFSIKKNSHEIDFG